MSEINHERLLRAIRCLQLIQRTNAPKSSIFKAAAKALAPLMVEQATMPELPGRPRSRAKNFTPPAPEPSQDVQRISQLLCDERGHLSPHSPNCPEAAPSSGDLPLGAAAGGTSVGSGG